MASLFWWRQDGERAGSGIVGIPTCGIGGADEPAEFATFGGATDGWQASVGQGIKDSGQATAFERAYFGWCHQVLGLRLGAGQQAGESVREFGQQGFGYLFGECAIIGDDMDAVHGSAALVRHQFLVIHEDECGENGGGMCA
jgi:hypothetical protein